MILNLSRIDRNLVLFVLGIVVITAIIVIPITVMLCSSNKKLSSPNSRF